MNNDERLSRALAQVDFYKSVALTLLILLIVALDPNGCVAELLSGRE